ncbi:hypothetical protein ACFLRN_05640 [Thermoproteota archaeon]
MKKRRILSAVVGIIQGVIGISFGVLAVLLVVGIIEIQALLNTPSEFMSLYILILGLFSIFSVVSGLFLVREGRK